MTAAHSWLGWRSEHMQSQQQQNHGDAAIASKVENQNIRRIESLFVFGLFWFQYFLIE